MGTNLKGQKDETFYLYIFFVDFFLVRLNLICIPYFIQIYKCVHIFFFFFQHMFKGRCLNLESVSGHNKNCKRKKKQQYSPITWYSLVWEWSELRMLHFSLQQGITLDNVVLLLNLWLLILLFHSLSCMFCFFFF